MAIFLGHISALTFWRSGFLPNDFGSSRARPPEKPVCRKEIITAARELLNLCRNPPTTHILRRNEMPFPTAAALHFESVLRTIHTPHGAPAANPRMLDLVVFNANLRRRSHGIRSRIYNPDVSARSFIRVSEHCYVSTPEACFLQLASELTYARLLMAGMELCGTFAIDPTSQSGFIQRKWDDSPTTVEKLTKHLKRAAGSSSSAKAIAAAQRLADGAASPAEAKTYLMLCLPRREGGYGIPRPSLNAPVTLVAHSDSTIAMPRLEGRRPDFMWPASNFALEYDSDAWHSVVADISRDSKRRSELEYGDIHVLTLTNQQLRNRDSFDEIAHVIAKRIGMRLPKSLPAPARKKQASLRRELLLEM